MARGKKFYALSEMQIGMLRAMVDREIKRVHSLPTGEDRNAGQTRASEKAVWLIELDSLAKSLSEGIITDGS